MAKETYDEMVYRFAEDVMQTCDDSDEPMNGADTVDWICEWAERLQQAKERKEKL